MSKLTRRMVLKGFAGLGLALPALELTHGRAWAQATTPKAKRFIVFFEHGGTIANVDREGNQYSGPRADGCTADAWSPLNDGVTDQTLRGMLGPIHQPLAGFEDDFLVLRGINNLAAMQQSAYAGDHGWANGTALTNAVAIEDVNPNGSFFNAQGPSIDAVIAARMAESHPVPFPSVNLEISAHNYGTPFFNGADQPLSGETDPMAAFSRLFTNVDTTGMPDPRVLRAQKLKKSVLDGTSSGLALFKNKVSAQDKRTIDAHLSLIRGIELQLEQMPVPEVGCMKPMINGPFGEHGDTVYGAIIPSVGPAHVDIMIAAMQCGLTNVGTINMGDFYNDWMNDPYPAAYNIGHSLDHSANDTCPTGSDAAHFDDWYRTMLDNRVWRTQMFARLLAGLKSVPEGAGNMLDNSLILWTSEFSYGGVHSSANLPVVLAGKAGGAIRTGRHINYASTDPMTGQYVTSATLSNLFTSCLNACGYADTSFGGTFGDHYSYYPRTLVCREVSGGLPMLT